MIKGVFFAALLLPACLLGQNGESSGSWQAWQFLLGEWVGEGSGGPGQGTGGFTFYLDLQNTILVRKNYANYPATKDRPSYSHEDLMVIYHEKDIARAIYFDNEMHVIHYSVEFSRGSNTVAFLSDLVASAPRYRLTYAKTGPETIRLTFDIAPADTPDAFSRYIEATARKKK